MGDVQTEAIESGAATTPVKLEELKKAAKTEQSKILYMAFTDYTSARDAYQELCNSVGVAPSLKADESVGRAQRVISMFHVVQTLSRKLRGDETRAKLCSDAKKVVGDSVPAPLMLMLQEGAAGSQPTAVGNGADDAEMDLMD